MSSTEFHNGPNSMLFVADFQTKTEKSEESLFDIDDSVDFFFFSILMFSCIVFNSDLYLR